MKKTRGEGPEKEATETGEKKQNDQLSSEQEAEERRRGVKTRERDVYCKARSSGFRW